MAVPIIESIAANLLTTINGVTTGNGYNQTIVVKRASRVDYDTETPDDLGGLLYQLTREKLEGPFTLNTWRQRFNVTVIALNDDGSAVTIDTRLNQIAEDITKAIRVDITRGGFAYQTDIGESAFAVAEDGSISAVVLEIIIDYRVLKSDPYTKG